MRSQSPDDAIDVVTIEDVKHLHGKLARDRAAGRTEYGVGPWTERVEDGWQAIIATLHPVFGQDKYPTVILYGGATTQYLVDGNKRLAAAVMLAQLRLNVPSESRTSCNASTTD